MLRERFGVEAPMSFVPDAALHVTPDRVHLPMLRPDRPKVGLCLRLDRAEERFAPPFAESFEHFAGTLVESLSRLVSEDRAQIVFTPHLLTRTDLEMAQLLRQRLPADSLVLLHEAVPGIYGPASLEIPSLLAGVYQRLDTVLGQRLHSLIMPFSVGTPVVSMTSTESSAWMQDEFQQPPWMHLDLNRPERDVTVERMTGALRRALEERRAISERAFVRKGELVATARGATRALIERTLMPRPSARPTVPAMAVAP